MSDDVGDAYVLGFIAGAAAERERIAAECESRAGLEAATGDWRGLQIAASIARGEQ